MIWFFKGRARDLQYEVRLHAEGRGFEIVTTFPDGYERVERAASRLELLLRTVETLKSLRDQGWVTSGPTDPSTQS